MIKRRNINRAIIYVFLQICLLIFLISAIFCINRRWLSYSLPGYICVAVYLIILLSIAVGVIIIRVLFLLYKDRIETTQLELRLEQEKQHNIFLSMQKHDFRNHLMAIEGFLQMERYDQARHYIRQACEDIEGRVDIGKTSFPIIDGFLYIKQKEADDRGIDLSVDINSNLSNIPVKGVELCRILGNLIDNAFRALEGVSQPVVEVDIYEDNGFYIFSVYNSGPPIVKEHMKQLFDAGFTTKGSNNTGLGLYIVKEIVDRYNGNIDVVNQDTGGVSFDITIPEKGD